MDTNTFIEKAKKIHGDKYDYSKVEYVNSKTKVCIICPEHGEFWQIPNGHLNGNGCKKCQYKRIKEKNSYSTEKFIEKAKKIYGDKYDYSKVEYINSQTKVCIICPEHGEFLITPNDFLDGHQCKKCSNKSRKEKLSLQINNFIEKAKKVHGNKYDYSKVEYVNYDTKVCIICPEHGEFWQTPHSHISGKGCKKCGIEKRIKNTKLSVKDFIKKSKKKHGDKYDYSLIKKYTNGKEKVPIICKKHGIFYQRVEDHLFGHGCKKCYCSKIENEIIDLLTKNSIKFIYRAKNILGISELDFYLPEYNAAIECQGIQHFIPTNFGNETNSNLIYENFIKQKLRDTTKFELCLKNGIKLFYFSNLKIFYPYKVYTNKEELLQEIKNGQKRL